MKKPPVSEYFLENKKWGKERDDDGKRVPRQCLWEMRQGLKSNESVKNA